MRVNNGAGLPGYLHPAPSNDSKTAYQASHADRSASYAGINTHGGPVTAHPPNQLEGATPLPDKKLYLKYKHISYVFSDKRVVM